MMILRTVYPIAGAFCLSFIMVQSTPLKLDFHPYITTSTDALYQTSTSGFTSAAPEETLERSKLRHRQIIIKPVATDNPKAQSLKEADGFGVDVQAILRYRKDAHICEELEEKGNPDLTGIGVGFRFSYMQRW